jgi:hypothetical protein
VTAKSIDDRPHPVHIKSFEAEAYTTCGRMRIAGVQVAKFLSDVTCKRCRRKYEQAKEDDSVARSEARNRIEARAKAFFEIWDRFNACHRVWEHLSINEQEAFRQIFGYAESLFRDDEDERRDKKRSAVQGR